METRDEQTDSYREVFRVGEPVHSGPVAVLDFDSKVLSELLKKLVDDGIFEFAIDLIVEERNGKLLCFLDSESRNFRRMRDWVLPAPGSELDAISRSLGLDIISRMKEATFEKPDGIDLSSRFHRATIELTFANSGVKPRAYDRAPHIDALSAYVEMPVVEGLWSDEVSTILYEGITPWEDTTKFAQKTKGLTRLNIPPKSLSVSRGATLIHGAPETENDRWLLRCFVEPVSVLTANQCRTALGPDLSFRSR